MANKKVENDKESEDSSEKKSDSSLNIIDRLTQNSYEVIPVDEDVKWCVFSFFNAYDEKIDEYKHHAKSEKKLNYQLMKRFIFTAYNNLVELDQTISRGKVFKPYKDIKNVYNIYSELNLFVSKPISLSFEKLFLRKQKTYIEIKDNAELMIAKMELSKARAEALKSSMNTLEGEMKMLSQKSENFLELEKLYKKKNGEYVDNLHEISLIKDKREVLLNKIKSFEMQNLEIFSSEFYEILNKTVDSINEILDGLAFEFDTLLWEEARNSEVIKKFFAEAKIQGSFSSKTFLKYYLNSIDEEQSKGQNSELFDLLKYLESVSTRHIFILGNDSDEIQSLRYAIESIDKDYIVSSSISSDRVIIEHKRRNINLLMVNYSLKGIKCLDFLKDLWHSCPETKEEISVLVVFDNPSFEQVDELGFLGVEYYMRRHNNIEEYIEKVKSII